jgi:L-asparaginase II
VFEDITRSINDRAHRLVDVGSLAMTMDELRSDYVARLAAANKMIAEQNRTIARLHIALMETPSQFLIGALLRDRRDESK